MCQKQDNDSQSALQQLMQEAAKIEHELNGLVLRMKRVLQIAPDQKVF